MPRLIATIDLHPIRVDRCHLTQRAIAMPDLIRERQGSEF